MKNLVVLHILLFVLLMLVFQFTNAQDYVLTTKGDSLTGEVKPLLRQLLESHMYHTYSTLDDLESRGNDGGGLLSAQHGTCDLWGVGKVSDPGFNDFDAGHFQTAAQVLFHDLVDLIVTRAQGHFRVGVKVVVRIHAGELTYCGVGLDFHERFIIVNFKTRTESIFYLL